MSKTSSLIFCRVAGIPFPWLVVSAVACSPFPELNMLFTWNKYNITVFNQQLNLVIFVKSCFFYDRPGQADSLTVSLFPNGGLHVNHLLLSIYGVYTLVNYTIFFGDE